MIRRGSRFLSPATDSEDRFGSRRVQYHRPDVRFFERLVLDSHSRRRRVSRAPPSSASDGVTVAQREARSYSDDDDVYWSPLGTGLRIRITHRRIELSPEVIVRAVLGAQETEDTCREAATATAPGETPGLSELGPTTAPLSAPSYTLPGQGVSDGDPLALGDSMADPRCEERQHPRRAVAEAAYFDHAVVKKQSTKVRELEIPFGAGPRGETFCESRSAKGRNNREDLFSSS